ncbi:hypothetical protein [Pleurochrysis sp. endemic virus 2]|nr:hypothetical protein [Pleurochrysis sp. endemic virus 2]
MKSSQHPLLAANRKRSHLPWGIHGGYFEDIYHSCGVNPLPRQDQTTYERALRFREKEKQEQDRIKVQRDKLAQLTLNHMNTIDDLNTKLRDSSLEYSKLKDSYERILADSDTARELRSVQTPDVDTVVPVSSPIEEQNRVHTDAELHDSRGQSSEHRESG